MSHEGKQVGRRVYSFNYEYIEKEYEMGVSKLVNMQFQGSRQGVRDLDR